MMTDERSSTDSARDAPLPHSMTGHQQENMRSTHQGEDPGSKVHGNFPFYYQFNPVQARLALISDEQLLALLPHTLPPSPYKPLTLLDIGCNRGDLTVALARRLSQLTGRRVVADGWDIDWELIQQARALFGPEGADVVPGTREDRTHVDGSGDEDGRADDVECHFDCVDVSNAELVDKLAKRRLAALGMERYDVVCLFSVTMWIHIHTGDDTFLSTLSRFASIASSMIVEPQESKSYGSCRRRLKRTGKPLPPMLDGLALRGDRLFPAIKAAIQGCGLQLLSHTVRKEEAAHANKRKSTKEEAGRGEPVPKATKTTVGSATTAPQPQQRPPPPPPPESNRKQNGDAIAKTVWKRPLWLYSRSS